MRLVKHKRRVLTWSLALWPVYIAGLLGILPYIVPFLDGYLPRWLLILILALSPFGRVVEQRKLKENDDADQ
ncbi:hypothetical protein [Rhizobium sp. N324]|uniref:hypothetical protein n=1 Tax=Rhizobium sp. N324 TaxID=1703969 RepID=UPI0007E96229|nr:hypothetical protein [Rhizobium sp. N324]ANM12034.1 hypothetical protein AMK05_CH03685 [Rhizobium sp. N324]